MCGIIAYTGTKQATPIIVKGLRQLEYRGYDSAGIAVLHSGINMTRSVGNIKQLARKLVDSPLTGLCGIGHTRWATHGQATLSNTHPHQSGKVTLVHNGVITNYQSLREKLTKQNIQFKSATDTEVIAALIDHWYSSTKHPLKAISCALQELEGSWALAILFDDKPGYTYCATHLSPLMVSTTNDGTTLTSDTQTLEHGSLAYVLPDHSITECSPANFETYSYTLQKLSLSSFTVSHEQSEQLGAHPDYMHKEIYDQPGIAKRLLVNYSTPHTINRSLLFYGCGSAFHAGLAAKYELQKLATHPIFVELSSDSSALAVPAKTLGIAISQSGETADTLNCFEALSARNIQSWALVNAPHSRLARLAKISHSTMAGQEVSVASTKAFTAQLLSLRLLFGGNQQLLNVSHLMRKTLDCERTIQDFVKSIGISPYWLVLGKDTLYPIALESALKIREITYLPCFAVPTSEMKHGTHALLSEDSMAVFFLPKGASYDKQRASLEEVCARSLNVIVITDEQNYLPANSTYCIKIPYENEQTQQFSFALAGQLLAYHLAKKLKRNIDRPRNLAKSVTVE